MKISGELSHSFSFINNICFSISLILVSKNVTLTKTLVYMHILQLSGHKVNTWWEKDFTGVLSYGQHDPCEQWEVKPNVFDTVKQVVEILAVRSYLRLMYCTDPGPGEHIRGFMTSSQSNPSELHWPHIKVCPQEQLKW